MNSRKKILIVDNEQINLDFFDVVLSKLGFVVEKAENGEEALEKVKRFLPDLIILDSIMPKISGWEVTKTLKNDPKYKDIPIIMMSAVDDAKEQVEGLELGVDDYITKPYNFSVLLARIRLVLRNRELYGQIRLRDSRLSLAEELGMDMKNQITVFLNSIDELDNAIAASAQTEVESMAKIINEKTTVVRKNIAELDARIERTLAEWETLKKDEIGISALEQNIQSEVKPEEQVSV